MRLDTEDYRRRHEAVEGKIPQVASSETEYSPFAESGRYGRANGNGELPPRVDHSDSEESKPRGWSFGGNTVTQSAFEIVARREPPSGPPHKRRSSGCYR
jgi:hypothetical protein